MVDTVMEALANFQRQGSSWIFKSIISLEIHTVKYEPPKGSPYIPLPCELAKKKAIVDIKNEHNECFKWAVTRALYPVENNPDRIKSDLKEKSKDFNLANITFPVDLKTIIIFERQNATISINVFVYESVVYPLRMGKHGREIVINIL